MSKIRYKVVNKRNMTSCIIPLNSRYCLDYKEKIVTAVPGSMGIMVFKKLIDAERFCNVRNYEWKVIKVRAIGKAYKPKHLCEAHFRASATTIAFNVFYIFYNRYKNKVNWTEIFYALNPDSHLMFIPAPIGTECYQSVEVL